MQIYCTTDVHAVFSTVLPTVLNI